MIQSLNILLYRKISIIGSILILYKWKQNGNSIYFIVNNVYKIIIYIVTLLYGRNLYFITIYYL